MALPYIALTIWASLLKRVLSIDLERCPRDHPAALGLIAAIPSGPLIRRLLGLLKLAAEPPPLTPVRLEPGHFAWISA